MDVALVGVCEPKNAFLLLDTTRLPRKRSAQKLRQESEESTFTKTKRTLPEHL